MVCIIEICCFYSFPKTPVVLSYKMIILQT